MATQMHVSVNTNQDAVLYIKMSKDLKRKLYRAASGKTLSKWCRNILECKADEVLLERER